MLFDLPLRPLGRYRSCIAGPDERIALPGAVLNREMNKALSGWYSEKGRAIRFVKLAERSSDRMFSVWSEKAS
jgi:hypothetical protein